MPDLVGGAAQPATKVTVASVSRPADVYFSFPASLRQQPLRIGDALRPPVRRHSAILDADPNGKRLRLRAELRNGCRSTVPVFGYSDQRCFEGSTVPVFGYSDRQCFESRLSTTDFVGALVVFSNEEASDGWIRRA